MVRSANGGTKGLVVQETNTKPVLSMSGEGKTSEEGRKAD